MDFSKIKKISFILLILFILLFPFWCVKGFCSENTEIDGTIINGLALGSNDYNGVLHSGSSNVIYFPVESGKKYNIVFDEGLTSGANRYIFQSPDIPAVGVSYNFIAELNAGNSFTYVANDEYLAIFSLSANVDLLNLIKVYELPSGMSDSVDSLVSNVGIDSIWNIFDISINYIVVVVLFAFGCYIIFRIIKKISRGKEGL